MIIVNQNKTQIFNFNNINYLQMNKISSSEFTIEINYSDCNYDVIAKYKTEERTKEVLKEIIQAKTDFEYYKYADQSERNELDPFMKTHYNFFDTYEMPKE